MVSDKGSTNLFLHRTEQGLLGVENALRQTQFHAFFLSIHSYFICGLRSRVFTAEPNIKEDISCQLQVQLC